MESFKTILQVGGVSLNVTTFNNLQTTGEIRLLQNKTLADGIVKYYNTGYLGWETALRDYTRNITAPYLLNFDYIPQNKNESEFNNSIKLADDVYDYDKPAKPLSAYKSDYFIINTLRHKIWNLEGLIIQYNTLLTHAKSLDEEIQKTLEN